MIWKVSLNEQAQACQLNRIPFVALSRLLKLYDWFIGCSSFRYLPSESITKQAKYSPDSSVFARKPCECGTPGDVACFLVTGPCGRC